MLDSMLVFSLVVAATGAGLMAGVYFAFSTFIMQSLDQLGPGPATDAMNSINKVILRSWFMALFFGSTLIYIVLGAVALLATDLAGRSLLFTAALIYVVGMFLCTARFNVPLNNRLTKAAGDDKSKAETWNHYFRHWTRWNHLRAVGSLVALVLTIAYLVSYA